MTRSLATCEHSPPLLPDLTPNSSEDSGKGGTKKTSRKLSVVRSLLMEGASINLKPAGSSVIYNWTLNASDKQHF